MTLKEGYPLGIGLLIASIVIALLCLKFYDEPVRNRLTNKFLRRKVS